MSHKLCCLITGKVVTVGNEYYDKKVLEYGTEEKYNSLYVSRQAKNLLKRGYKVKEIRDLLKSEENLPEISDKKVKEILSVDDEEATTYENSSVKKSDPDVAEYISALR
jgi:DNA-binding transcriptional MerR regulator